MKRFITLIVAILLFAVAILLGLKNQQLVDINYVIAENEIRLATLMAIVFILGFISASFFAGIFMLKVKMRNGQLRRLNNKQTKELTQLRENSSIEKV